MNIMIASDIHGSTRYCRDMLCRFAAEKADKLILLGDILYHGPRNDLPEAYAPKEVAALLNTVQDKVLCVRGNCDAEVDQMMLDFPILEEYALLCTEEYTIFATHGHHFHTKALPPLQHGDILLHGHTHIPAWEAFGKGNLYLNPGSVSLPKDGSFHSYMMIHKTVLQWKTLDGTVYHRLLLNHQ